MNVPVALRAVPTVVSLTQVALVELTPGKSLSMAFALRRVLVRVDPRGEKDVAERTPYPATENAMNLASWTYASGSQQAKAHVPELLPR